MSLNENPAPKRESFTSRLGFLLVSAGCAIGIGNVWRFPTVAGQSGGGFRGKSAPAEPATFEDRLKQFMASSDSKLSELRQAERRNSRRGGRK